MMESISMTRVRSWFLASREQLSSQLELSRLRIRDDKPNKSIVALAWLTLRSTQLPHYAFVYIFSHRWCWFGLCHDSVDLHRNRPCLRFKLHSYSLERQTPSKTAGNQISQTMPTLRRCRDAQRLMLYFPAVHFNEKSSRQYSASKAKSTAAD